MYRSILIGLLAIVLLAPAIPVSAQDGAAGSDYDWAYIFAGQTQLLRIDVGPNAVLFKLHDITVDGEMASDARSAIDNLQGVGDGDGTVTEEEVISFEALATAYINNALPSEFDFEMITIDGKRAFGADDRSLIAITGLDISGADGSTSSTDPISTDIEAMLRFDSVSQSASKHDIRFENLYGDFTSFAASDAPPAEVIVSGYKSWAIDGDSIQPVEFRDRLEADELTLTNSDFAYFDEMGEGLLFTVEGDPDEQVSNVTERSPAIGPVVLLSVLGLALVALRRRL